jgi:HD superfamily phosphodiesterase
MTGKLLAELVRFFGKDRRRIAHALKVYAYAEIIAELEGFSREQREHTVYAAILHDVGIKIAEEKYGSCTAKQQEEEGPQAAADILSRAGANAGTIDRVCFLIAHHHTPSASEDPDFRALLEADFLVNLEEGDIPLSSAGGIGEKHFRTETGKTLLRTMFL